MKNKKLFVSLLSIFISVSNMDALDQSSRAHSDESVKKSDSADSIVSLTDFYTQVEKDKKTKEQPTLATQFAPRNSMESIREEGIIPTRMGVGRTQLDEIPDDSISGIGIEFSARKNPRFTEITLHPFKLQINDQYSKVIIIVDKAPQKEAPGKTLTKNASILHRACVASLFLEKTKPTLDRQLNNLLSQHTSLEADIKSLPADPKKMRTARSEMHKKYIFPAIYILETALKK